MPSYQLNFHSSGDSVSPALAVVGVLAFGERLHWTTGAVICLVGSGLMSAR